MRECIKFKKYLMIINMEWSSANYQSLRDAISKHSTKNWDIIASECGSTASKCETEYKRMVDWNALEKNPGRVSYVDRAKHKDGIRGMYNHLLSIGQPTYHPVNPRDKLIKTILRTYYDAIEVDVHGRTLINYTGDESTVMIIPGVIPNKWGRISERMEYSEEVRTNGKGDKVRWLVSLQREEKEVQRKYVVSDVIFSKRTNGKKMGKTQYLVKWRSLDGRNSERRNSWISKDELRRMGKLSTGKEGKWVWEAYPDEEQVEILRVPVSEMTVSKFYNKRKRYELH